MKLFFLIKMTTFKEFSNTVVARRQSAKLAEKSGWLPTHAKEIKRETLGFYFYWLLLFLFFRLCGSGGCNIPGAAAHILFKKWHKVILQV